MKKVRWGIVGPGNIANKFAKAIKNVEIAELVAVATRSEEKGKIFAEQYGIKNVFTGYEKMAESDLVDAVYIATPHPFHKLNAEMFLNTKKHFMCEKPVCINAYQAEKLKECAKENNVFLMEAMWTRFLPAVREAVSVANSGEIGEILGLTADFCYNLKPEEEPKIYQNEMAGGSLLDVGVYGVHFASMFLGNSPESVTSVMNKVSDVDAHSVVNLKYKNGAIATITSAINLEKPSSAYIYGSKGHIFIPHFYGANDFYVYKDNLERHIEKRAIGDGFEEEIIEACNMILKGKTESSILPMDESIKMLKIMDEARKQNELKYPFEGE